MLSKRLRKDFPALENNPGIICLDSAATTLKPGSVIGAESAYYREFPANIARGSHKMSRMATRAYEDSRSEVARFILAKESELVFTRNATESINLAAVSLERAGQFREGDEVVVSPMEGSQAAGKSLRQAQCQ